MSAQFTIPPSATSTADINAAIAAVSALGGGSVKLLGENYSLSGSLVLASNVELAGSPSGWTTLTPSTNPSSSLADDRENALIKVKGAITTTLSTTLSAVAQKGHTSLSLTSGSGLSAGMWLAIEGHNDPSLEMYGISSGANITLREILEIDSSYTSGTTVPVAMPVLQWHTPTNGSVGQAMSVKTVSPIRNVILRDLNLAGDGLNWADGIALDYAFGVRLYNVKGAGFSRSLLDVRASRECEWDRIHSRGECNAVVYCDSALDCRGDHVTSSPRGKRFHPYGVPRAGVFSTNRSTLIRHGDVHIQKMCLAMYTIGGVDWSVDTLRSDDTNLTERVTRDYGNSYASVLQQGAGPIDQNETGLSHHYGRIEWSKARQSLSSELQCAVWLHDVQNQTLGQIAGENNEQSASDSPYANGVWIQDASGSIGDAVIKGCNFGLHLRGSHQDFTIDSWTVMGASGSGYGGSVGLYLNYNSPGAQGPRITRLRINGTNTPFYTGSDWASASVKDPWFHIDHVDADAGYQFDGVLVAKNVSGTTLAPGDVVELDVNSTANERRVVNHSGQNPRGAVVVFGNADGAFVLICPLPSTYAVVNCDSAAVVMGDLLIASSTAKLACTGTPSSPENALGRALKAKASGSAGPVVVGPVA